MRGLTRDLETAVREVLDLRLSKTSPRPLAVALSGGGDSLALALIAATWARAQGRALMILTVDHGLSPLSCAWTEACAATAERLGAAFQSLAWEGDKPATGLPAAARAARHRLIAEAARAAGAQVILMGHTASDRAEAFAMRQTGSSTPSPRAWSPSPVWPEGRGLFLCRPLIGARRAELRAWLTERGETWIDDPANEDLRTARGRARAGLTSDDDLADGRAAAGLTELAAEVSDLAGGLMLSRRRLQAAPPLAAAALVAAACLCASGGARPPRRDRLTRLTGLLQEKAPVIATLAGARIEADEDRVTFLREAGRDGLGLLTLTSGQTGVWDGRYEVTAERTVTLQALAGHAARLSPNLRTALSRLPAEARGVLPFIAGEGSSVLEPSAGLAIRPLALARLRAACGMVTREPD